MNSIKVVSMFETGEGCQVPVVGWDFHHPGYQQIFAIIRRLQYQPLLAFMVVSDHHEPRVLLGDWTLTRIQVTGTSNDGFVQFLLKKMIWTHHGLRNCHTLWENFIRSHQCRTSCFIHGSQPDLPKNEHNFCRNILSTLTTEAAGLRRHTHMVWELRSGRCHKQTLKEAVSNPWLVTEQPGVHIVMLSGLVMRLWGIWHVCFTISVLATHAGPVIHSLTSIHNYN